jgi:hypothetical protein
MVAELEDPYILVHEKSYLRCKLFCRFSRQSTNSEYDREKLQERLAKLAGGVALIRVGGATKERSSNTFSAEDITALVTIDFATKATSFSAPGEHAALERWYENVSCRPSVGA